MFEDKTFEETFRIFWEIRPQLKEWSGLSYSRKAKNRFSRNYNRDSHKPCLRRIMFVAGFVAKMRKKPKYTPKLLGFSRRLEN